MVAWERDVDNVGTEKAWDDLSLQRLHMVVGFDFMPVGRIAASKRIKYLSVKVKV